MNIRRAEASRRSSASRTSGATPRPPGPRSRRFAPRFGRVAPGTTLVEAVVALAIAAVLAAAAAASLRATLRLGLAATAGVEALDAARTVSLVLRADLPTLVEPDATISDDSVRLRVFRGIAIACDTTAAGVLVRFRGPRLPEPDKDSVLVLLPDRELPLGLITSAHAPGCAPLPDESVFRWSIDSVPPPGMPILLFETGTYFLADRALRYRRGAGGRQPMTAELVGARSAFQRRAQALDVTVEIVQGGRAQPRLVRLRLPLLNEDGGP